MAILKIVSGNKNLSYVIQKNPATGMFVKSLKQGALFAYFPKANGQTRTNEYVIYFKDASDEITYKKHPDEQFEYMNPSKYNDARFINDAIQECLHAAREHKGESGVHDVPANHMVFVNMVETQFKTIDIFRRYFPEIEMRAELVSRDNYRMTFTTQNKMTLRYLLQVVNLFGVFAQLNSPTYSYLTEDLVKKYVRICNEVDAPYFIRYLIKVRMCRSESIFNSVKDELVNTKRYDNILMTFGDTHDARIAWIKGLLLDKPQDPKEGLVLSGNRSIIDIGTGIDFRYLKIFAPKLQEKGLMYYAIEKDFDARERIKAGIRTRNLEDTVEIYESLEEFMKYHNEYLKNEHFDVICTEVLEHNEFNEAKKIVNIVSNGIKFGQFIISVPCAEFNQFYGLDGFRHDDHKWEAKLEDLKKLTDGVHNKDKILMNVGDVINDIPVTYGIRISSV